MTAEDLAKIRDRQMELIREYLRHYRPEDDPKHPMHRRAAPVEAPEEPVVNAVPRLQQAARDYVPRRPILRERANHGHTRQSVAVKRALGIRVWR